MNADNPERSVFVPGVRVLQDARTTLSTVLSAFIGVHLRFLCVAVVVSITGCATAPPQAPQQSGPPAPDPSAFGKYYKDDGPPDKVPDNLAQAPDAVPRDEPFHKFANRPYTVFGKSYAPVVNKEPTKERGMASWYGRKFHGQKTASGEPYDMFAMTAAHKTLPIPSYARVTNVKNGLSVVVRINDRGPFHGGRVIDLSYAAASRLGFVGAGSGEVEIQSIVPGSL
jgi:rare lipoprotein A